MAHQVAEQWIQAHAAVVGWLMVGGSVLAALGRYLPRVVLELLAAWSKDERRQRLCLEMLRLRRKDAATLASYLDPPPGAPPPPPAAVLPPPRRRFWPTGHRDAGSVR